MEQQILTNQLQILNKYYDSKNFRTGLGARKFLKNRIFSNLGREINNHILSSGRYSAYCNTNIDSALVALLKKFKLNSGQRILAHPLVPGIIINRLLQNHLEIDAFDIDTNTWNWKSESLSKWLLEHTIPSLVIIYTTNGLAEEIESQIEICNSQNIPVLLIIDNPILTHSLIKCLNMLTIGAAIFNTGQYNFCSKLAQTFNFEKVLNTDCILSYYLEIEPMGILDNANSSNQENDNLWNELTQCLIYLFKYQAKISNWKSSLNFNFKNFDNNFNNSNSLNVKSFFTKKYQNIEEAKSAILKIIPQIIRSGTLSDLFLDLDLAENSSKVPITQNTFVDQYSKLNASASRFRSFFYSQVIQRPPGTIEAPSFFLNRVYTVFFIYSTESVFWCNYLRQQNTPCAAGFQLHAIFEMRPGLEKTKFIAKHALRISLTNESRTDSRNNSDS